jgi:hypothetical protein
MKNLLLSLLVLSCLSDTYAQMGVNTDGSLPHPSAQLDVKSITKAFYPPRMTTAQRTSFPSPPTAGAMVFDTDLNGLFTFNGSVWVAGSGLTLPYSGSSVDNSGVGVFKINETGATINGIGLYGSSTNGTGLFGSTNSYRGVSGFAATGIAGYFISSFGTALLTKGALQFGGSGIGTLGVGKFLKSTSVNGDAQWSDLTPFSEVKSISNNLIYAENTLTGNNLAVIMGVTNSSTTGAGVSGTASNTATTNNNAGVRGINKSTNGFGYGVQGVHEHSGVGVLGESLVGIGVLGKSLDTGIKGVATGNFGSIGVHGEAYNKGVYGKSTGNYSVGVYGEEAGGGGTNSAGVFGKGTITGVHGEGAGRGVEAYANEVLPDYLTYAVEARNLATNDYGTGVLGTVNGSGTGVFGRSISGDGILGISNSGNAGYFTSTSGYALITGTGRVGIGKPAPTAQLDVVRGNAPDGTAIFRGTTHVSHFNYSLAEDTYIRGGKFGSNVIINDVAGLGNVIIGLGTATEKLHVFGNIKASGIAYATAFTIASDVRFKKNIVALNNSLANLLKINGVRYDLRKDEFPEKNFSDKTQIGFIAQELEKIFPEMVFTDTQGYKSVDYARLTPVLVEAIKELRNENASLKSRLDKIEAMLTNSQLSANNIINK